jgi:hypothetical protein
MANIAFSTPFTKSFLHSDFTVGTTSLQILNPTLNAYDKRVMLLIQNQSNTATIEVIFNTSGSNGIVVMPNQSITIENYNGAVRAVASAAGTPVHTAVALV